MLGDALSNYGFGNREQTLHRSVERLKLFRPTAHVAASMIAPLTLVIAVPSEPPTPSSRPEGESQQSIRKHQNRPSDRSQILALSNRPESEPSGEQGGNSSPNKHMTDWIQALAAIATLGVTIAIWFVYKSQADTMEKQWNAMQASNDAANRNATGAIGAAKAAQESAATAAAALKVMEKELVATTNTAVAAQQSVDIAAKSLVYGQRAYLDVSYDEPGLKFETMEISGTGYPTPDKKVQIALKVANGGNTPAKITATLTNFVFTDQPLPPTPAYDSRNIAPAMSHVARGTHYTVLVTDYLEVALIRRVLQEPSFDLYVIGYVDYIDIFKTHHRLGYGFIYDPFFTYGHMMYMHKNGRYERVTPREKNLTFVASLAYNYERERVKGEGNDWDES